LSTTIEILRTKSQAIQAKRKFVLEKLFELERSLGEALEGIAIFGKSGQVTLGQVGHDEWIYGYLSFSEGLLDVAYRSTEDDYVDAVQKVPEDYQSFSIKHISICSSEWLEKLVDAKIINSLSVDLEAKLDQINSAADGSVESISKILASQAEELNSDTVEILSHMGDDSLLKGWSTARSLVAIEPSDSITRSSSYLESVCRKILADLEIPLPNKKEITNLISECVKALGLSDDSEAQSDLTQLIGSLKGVCQAIGTLRTHFGTAHGSSPGDYQISSHDARLANNAAAAISVFLLQRHRDRLKGGGK
jgi:hypothetical protein